MRLTVGACALTCLAVGLSLAGAQSVFGQDAVFRDASAASMQSGNNAEKLQQIATDKASFAAEIVLRWESAARASGKWDMSYAQDLFGALMKLQPENLLAAGEASSYQDMMKVLMTGRAARAVAPKSLGDVTDDLVYTPVNPCRIVDTRNAGGPIPANTFRSFDVDGSSFTGQGGSSSSCGIPSGVATADAMSIAVTQPDAAGFFRAWSVSSSMPNASFLNFVANETTAVTTIVPVAPGGGTDFNLFSAGANAHAVIDVMGYFATPVATALDCTTASSAVTVVAVNAWTAIDVSCPAGRTATGGGYFSPEGTGGYPGVWTQTLPGAAYGFNGWRTWVDNQTSGGRSVQTWVACCRIPGR